MNDTTLAHTFGRMLREFGYPDVTDGEVLVKIEAIRAGVEPTEVVGMFVAGWLEEYAS